MEVVGDAARRESPPPTEEEPPGDIDDNGETDESLSRRKNPALGSSKWTSRPWQSVGAGEKEAEKKEEKLDDIYQLCKFCRKSFNLTQIFFCIFLIALGSIHSNEFKYK